MADATGTVRFVLEGESSGAVGAFNKVLKQQENMSRTFEKSTRRANGFSRGMQGVTRQVGQMVAGYISAQAAISAVNKAIQIGINLSKKAAEAGKLATPGLGILSQLAAGDEKERQRLQGKALEIRSKGAAGSIDEAARTLFAIESAGLGGDIDLVTDLRRNFAIEDAASLARSTATVSTAFGREEAGTSRQIISKSLGASITSPATAEEIAEAVAGTGAAARMVGVSDEESFAATAVLAASTGTAAQGGTQVEAFLTALAKKGGFKGKGIRGSIEEIDALGLDEAGLTKFFGRKEAVSAFEGLKLNLDTEKGFEASLANVRRAQEEDLAGQTAQLNKNDPFLNAAIVRNQQAGQLEVEEFRDSAMANLRQAAEADFRGKLRTDDAGLARTAAAEAGLFLDRIFAGDERFVEGVVNDDDVLTPEGKSQIQSVLEQIRDQGEGSGSANSGAE